MATNTQSIYERVGGEDGVTLLVDSFYTKVLDDKELAGFFTNTHIDRLKNMQKEFFMVALGGPIEFSDLGLSHAHQGKGIQTSHFKSFVNHLLDTLSEFDLTEEERYQVISKINQYVEDIAEDSASPMG